MSYRRSLMFMFGFPLGLRLSLHFKLFFNHLIIHMMIMFSVFFSAIAASSNNKIYQQLAEMADKVDVIFENNFNQIRNADVD